MTAATMSIEQFVNDLDELANSAAQAFDAAADASQLDEARVEFLGAKKGRLKAASKNMAAVAGPDKKQAGQKLNAVKNTIEQSFKQAQDRLQAGTNDTEKDPQFDATVPGKPVLAVGRLHPITQTINELLDIMGRLGFTAADVRRSKMSGTTSKL